MTQDASQDGVDAADLRASSAAHAKRSLLAAAAAWADVFADAYPPSARLLAHRAFRRHLEHEFGEAVERLANRRRNGSSHRPVPAGSLEKAIRPPDQPKKRSSGRVMLP